jgi:hypothetical protein
MTRRRKKMTISGSIDYLFEVAASPSKPVEHKRIGQVAQFIHEKLESRPPIRVLLAEFSDADISTEYQRRRLGEEARIGRMPNQRVPQHVEAPNPLARPLMMDGDGTPLRFPPNAVLYVGANVRRFKVEWFIVQGRIVGLGPDFSCHSRHVEWANTEANRIIGARLFHNVQTDPSQYSWAVADGSPFFWAAQIVRTWNGMPAHRQNDANDAASRILDLWFDEQEAAAEDHDDDDDGDND